MSCWCFWKLGDWIRKKKCPNQKIDCTKKGSIFEKESITLRQKKNSK